LVDLGSTNGTQVNGSRVTSMVLKPGDRLTLANRFDFEVVESAAGVRAAISARR
jgi:pSer/pThr/pTyr-binding forkhead associated (FHA) protein